MRTARLASATALILIGAMTAHAGPVPYEATIAGPDVEVRSGPSPVYYATGKLRQGERVTVVKEDAGWLGIKPSPDSFSWINSHLLQPSSDWRTGVVLADNAEVRIGSALTDQEPTVCQVRLPRGAQVIIRDFNKAYTDKGGWLAIYPPAQEVRYIPADALKVAPQVQTVQASPVTPSPVTPAPANVSSNAAENDLWRRAEQEEARNAEEAMRLYRQLAHQTSDHDLQMRCYNRIHFLREGNRGSVPSGYQPGQPSEASYPSPAGGRLAPTPNLQSPVVYPPSRYGQPPSQYTYYSETFRYPANPAPSYASTQQPVSLVPITQWSGQGRLRKASFFMDYKEAFALETLRGELIYVTALPGIDLKPYLNHEVDLYGPMVYRGDAKKNYMTVQYVKLAQ